MLLVWMRQLFVDASTAEPGWRKQVSKRSRVRAQARGSQTGGSQFCFCPRCLRLNKQLHSKGVGERIRNDMRRAHHIAVTVAKAGAALPLAARRWLAPAYLAAVMGVNVNVKFR